MIDSKDVTTKEAAKAVGDFFGLPPLSTAQVGDLAIAAGIIVVILLIARFLGRWLCGWLERSVVPKFSPAENQKLPQTEDFAFGFADLGALILLTIAAGAHGWPPYSNLLFDVAIAIAAAVTARRLALAFSVSRSAAMAIGVVCGVAVLVRRYEQLGFVEKSLDGFAISFGATRISLLDVLSLVFAGIVLYAIARLANRAAKALIRSRANLDVTQSLLAEKLAAIAITVIAIFAGIGMLGIDTTSLSVFSGAIGLGLGFGLQKIFSNLVSGIILLMDRSVKPGDVIVVGGSVGEVSRIGTRAVSVITRDGKEHLIPNELLMTEPVENWNYSSRNVRIRMNVRVGYESDLDLVERLLTEATRESPRVRLPHLRPRRSSSSEICSDGLFFQQLSGPACFALAFASWRSGGAGTCRGRLSRKTIPVGTELLGTPSRAKFAHRVSSCDCKKVAAKPSRQQRGRCMTDEEQIGQAIDEMYAMISGPAGPRDWSRQANCFLPEARQVRTWVDEQGRPAKKAMSLDEYSRDTTPFFEANDFFEVETDRRIDRFGNMAHVWSHYEARTAPDDPTPERRGINSIQLFRDPDRGWRIIHMIWDNERK